MKRAFFLLILLVPSLLLAQADFSAEWEDFYSYNNVKDFYKLLTMHVDVDMR